MHLRFGMEAGFYSKMATFKVFQLSLFPVAQNISIKFGGGAYILLQTMTPRAQCPSTSSSPYLGSHGTWPKFCQLFLSHLLRFPFSWDECEQNEGQSQKRAEDSQR